MNQTIADAKSRLSIPELMRQLGVPSRSIPKQECSKDQAQSVPCPWAHLHRHKDKKPSCSIYKNGTRIHCFACNYDMDGPEFLRRWRKLSNGQAIQEFINLAKVRPMSAMPVKTAERTAVSVVLSPLSEFDQEQIALKRALHVAAVRWACSLGVLNASQVCGCRSWVLTDGSRRIAEVRRLNGQNFPQLETLGERKAHTIKGSDKSWALGCELLRQYESVRGIMLVEGGPDYLAALHFLESFGVPGIMPSAMLGKSEMHPEAVQLIKGRRVRIYPHNDPDGGGLKAAHGWAAQLRAVGCQVDLFSFAGLRRLDGQPVKDLNDLTMIDQQHNQNTAFLQQPLILFP